MTDLQSHLKEIFGFDNFKGDQEAIIDSVLQGHDTFVIMPTGGGKSLCYQLPAMICDGTAIVVSPLIALMKNQVDAVRYTAGRDCVAHFLNSSSLHFVEIRTTASSPSPPSVTTSISTCVSSMPSCRSPCSFASS